MSFTYQPISGSYGEQLDKFFGLPNYFLEFNRENYILPKKFCDIAQEILDFKVRKDDVWMISYPRAGSTWCQEMVWLIGNDLNFDDAKKNIQQVRAPVLEFSALLSTDEFEKFMKGYGNSVELIKNSPSPRYIKTHLLPSLLPVELDKVKPKIVYIARNPKDVCVSYYHYLQLSHNMHCTFEEFCELFLNGKVPVGGLWPHYLCFWTKRHEENVLFLKYEDMKRDLKAVIRQTATFLEKTFADEQIDVLCNYLDFSNMKNNRAVNSEPILETILGKERKAEAKTFIRKGQIGDWKNYMTPDLSKKFDRWIEENTTGTSLYF